MSIRIGATVVTRGTYGPGLVRRGKVFQSYANHVGVVWEGGETDWWTEEELDVVVRREDLKR